ncbi:MAG: hypothetical protein ABIY51_16305, partial [Ferruginibacter sp.]
MMKTFSLILAMIMSNIIYAQNISINNTATPANASSMLDISSTTKGLLIPRMSTAAITSVNNPAKGLLVYDSSKNQLMVNMGTAAIPDWQTIVYRSGWNLTGNTGTNPAINFIGTTDANPLLFRIKNTWAGIIDSALNNTAIGFKALTGSNSGSTNSAFGSNALAGSTPGSGNTAIGNAALRMNGTGANFAADEGKYNTAVGHGSMQSNTTGLYNTAIGVSSLS